MVLSLYQGPPRSDGSQRRFVLTASRAVYAEVLVDIPARELGDKLFTYRIPDYLEAETFIGAQVLVPFGNQDVVGGYVVAVKDSFAGRFAVKDIAEVVDVDPLFDREYVDFLYFVADYYAASLSSVISASIPADFSPRLKRVVELASSDLLDPATTAQVEAGEEGARRILEVLRGTRTLSATFRGLRSKAKLNQARFYRSLSLLRQKGLILIKTESRGQAGPKTVATATLTGLPGASPRQEAIIGTLRRAGGQLPLARLITSAGTTYATIKKMSAQGIISISEEEVIRDPLDQVKGGSPTDKPPLTDDQERVLAVLVPEIEKTLSGSPPENDPVRPWLLHGVTGSGKTEIYLRLIEKTIARNRAAVLLVPEISLTPQLAERLKARFGKQIAIWHSALSAGERYDTWRRLRSGDINVLLGARSAVLVSMPRLGLIILDEEHDGSYKQSSPAPRYHARRLALEKARRAGALVVLGSATPDLSSFFEARKDERLLCLPERVFKQDMPKVAVVDMRAEFGSGNRSIFSRLLSDSLSECLAANEQAILLMNRRGYASHVFCRACGYVVKCRSCSVSMVFHQPLSGGPASPAYLACHHCGQRAQASVTCPSCQAPFLRQYGLGTQRVEQELSEIYPEASIVRLDSDVTQRRGAYAEVFRKFQEGKADILIGTQMVAKGLDIARVTLVGVLSADAAFNLPDYRSTERGFQLITQVSGRAGRGEKPGKVILQTYNPDLPALAWAKNHDYASFCESELAGRQELSYPPFSQLVRLVVSGAEPVPVQAACEELAEDFTRFLDDEVEPERLRVIGPAPCLIERLRGKWRHHLIVKNLAGDWGRTLISKFLRSRKLAAGLTLAVDVDAVDML